MSRFFSHKYDKLKPYTPGEQPTGKSVIKLNTNENPFPPSPKAQALAAEAAKRLNLYPDPECTELRRVIAENLGVSPENILPTNGSDEILLFAFMAFCDKERPAAFADITYGFYSVYAELNGVPYTEIPVKDDFTIDPSDYYGLNKTIFIANPNAPTCLTLTRDEIEGIIKANPDSVVVVDEAYVDFGGESCVPLINKYDNLLVTRTFSKSRSLAGSRLGFGVACPELIRDLNTIKYSTNPYNINSTTMAAGIGAMLDEEYTRESLRTVMENRDYVTAELRKLGFVLADSNTNFVFARHPEYDAVKLYNKLKENGILVRHFTVPRIAQYNRITIGTRAEMETLIAKLKVILEV